MATDAPESESTSKGWVSCTEFQTPPPRSSTSPTQSSPLQSTPSWISSSIIRIPTRTRTWSPTTMPWSNSPLEESSTGESLSPEQAVYLAEQLGVNPVTAVVDQYRRDGGYNTRLNRVLSDMRRNPHQSSDKSQASAASETSVQDNKVERLQEEIVRLQNMLGGMDKLHQHVSLVPMSVGETEEILSEDKTVKDTPFQVTYADYIHGLEVSLAASKEKVEDLQSKLRDLKDERYTRLEDDYCDLQEKMHVLKDDYEQQQQELVQESVQKKSIDDDKLSVKSVTTTTSDVSNEELEMTKKMCRARDVLISDLKQDNKAMEDKLCTLAKQHMHTLATGNIPVDKAVQANYLAVAPDFLRGADVYGETVLEVVGDQPQKLEWPGYGFYIEVPEGSLPPGVTASVAVKVILGGQFQFPEGSQLISALYWISSSEVFLNEVAVNMQHCAVIKNEEQCSTFRFIIAKCSQEVLPYRFKERVGVFNSHTKYGTIKLKQFSVGGATAPADTETRCSAFMLYKEQTLIPNLIADFHFVVVKDLEPYLQRVNNEYQGWSKDNDNLGVCVSNTDIQLSQEEQEVDPWKIVPLSSTKITKDDVTNFEPGRRIPHCAFELQLLPGKPLQRLFHKVDLIGVSSSNNFHIRYPQPEGNKVQAVPQPSKAATPPPHAATDSSVQQSASTSVKPKLVLTDPPVHCDLLNKVAVKTPQKWKEIGLQLQVSHADIEAISMGNQTPILCFSKVFEKWRTKESPPYTWGTIIDALRAPIVDEVQLANELVKLYSA